MIDALTVFYVLLETYLGPLGLRNQTKIKTEKSCVKRAHETGSLREWRPKGALVVYCYRNQLDTGTSI